MLFTRIFTALLLVFGTLTISAQTLRTISEIQTTKSATNDTSIHHGEYVKVRGVVVTPPDQWWQAPTRYNFWIQDSGQSGPKTGLQIYLSDGTKDGVTGVSGLQVGDYVEITGTVGYYRGAKQVVIDTNTTITVLNANVPVKGPDTVDVSVFNDANNQAQPTGEPWEGSYVVIKNVTVTAVSTSGTRGFFDVQDAAGNQMTIYDSFKQLNPNNGFVKPQVGDVFKSIAGILQHYNNGTTTNKYELLPFDSTQLVIASARPTVNSLTRNVVCPTSNDSVTIIADVFHKDTSATITSVVVKYGLSPTDSASNSINMVNVGGTWQAKIPPQANGTFVNYFVVATDNYGKQTIYPNYQPQCYTVNDNGCAIHDIQKTSNIMFKPTNYFSSGYENLTVVDVEGVVSASSSDLGYVYLQDEGFSTWGGIQLTGDPGIANYKTGDRIKVTGVVREYYGFTQIEVNSHQLVSSGNNVNPVVVPISALVSQGDRQTYSTEAYEGMFVRFTEPGLRVVEVKADTMFSSGSADYRVGTDPLDPKNGVRVIAGRQTNSVFSSLNVSYVNDSTWENVDGVMAVPACVVTDTTTMDSIQGIVSYQWRAIKLMPRTNKDFFGVKGTLGGQCVFSAITTISNNTQIKMFPNPASSFVTITTDAVNPITVKINNILGQTVITKTLKQQTSINVSNLPAGIYFVSFYNNNKLEGTMKLIVE